MSRSGTTTLVVWSIPREPVFVTCMAYTVLFMSLLQVAKLESNQPKS